MKAYLHLLAVCMLSIFAFSASQAQEQDKPTPEEKAYKFRTGLFQTFAWKFEKAAIAKFQGNQEAFDKNVADLAYLGTMLEEGFQLENSLPEGTTAKADIWENFADFEKKADSMRKAINGLSEPGAMADFDPKDFGSKNCGSCHREYRVK